MYSKNTHETTQKLKMQQAIDKNKIEQRKIDSSRMQMEMELGLQIYDFQKNGTKCYFSKLIKTLDGRISRNDISKTLDSLNDQCIIEFKWSMENGKCCREIILNEIYMTYFESISKIVSTETTPTPHTP